MAEVVRYSPNQSLLLVVIDTLGDPIDKSLAKCNEWQRERMKAEMEVFGATLTREITESELRHARVYLAQRKRT